jgi:predicted nucleic acid-binding protein
VTPSLLLDNSAWARLSRSQLSADRTEEVAALVESRRLGVCAPFELEVGYSARDPRHYAEIRKRLAQLPFFAIDSRIEQRATSAQRQLVEGGHHRLPPVDLLIAAIADRHSLGVLHYDADYDLIAERTDLRFESVWLAERGSL